jgi:ubiquinone/menaquinone biosynthesis C-methylase UbiE
MKNESSVHYREIFSTHIALVSDNPDPSSSNPEYQWRMHCYDNGLMIAAMLENLGYSISGKKILDTAAGWGGHGFAFLSQGAEVYLSDLHDYQYSMLKKCAEGTPCGITLGSCFDLPFADNSIDIMLGLELIEHIPDQNAFAKEIKRVLAQGGICLLSTPAKLRAIFEGEPHYNLKGIALFPLKYQRKIAESIFNRKYPFPVTQQFITSEQALRPYQSEGLTTEVLITGRKKRLGGKNKLLDTFFKRYLWNYFLLKK